MPGTPTSVTSCGSRSRRARSSASTQHFELPLSRPRAVPRGSCATSTPDARRRLDAPARPGPASTCPSPRPASARRTSMARSRRAVRRLVDDDAVHRRGRLEARGGVDDVAGRHPLARGRAARRADERLAGRDPDPDLQLAVVLGPVADRERGADGALGIVLVRDRRAEERHHRVADELLDGAAEALELARGRARGRAEERTHVLRVEPLGAARSSRRGRRRGRSRPCAPRARPARGASDAPHMPQSGSLPGSPGRSCGHVCTGREYDVSGE